MDKLNSYNWFREMESAIQLLIRKRQDASIPEAIRAELNARTCNAMEVQVQQAEREVKYLKRVL